jgi:prolyl-tRNA synthetase
MANAKNSKNIINGKEVQIGFDRMKFVQNCEKSFDTNFDYKRSQQHKFSHYHTMKNQMKNTAKSVVMSLAKDVPLVKEYNKASQIVNTAVILANTKDPLDALSAVFKQVPGAKECIKAINYAYNPSKIILDIGKKVLTMGLNAGSL